jgi:outer membrane murein-binding lipoprotein Lpp
MTTVEIVVIAVVVVVALLVLGGITARNRQLARTQQRFDTHLAQVNRDLAAAHAEDRGWEPAGLEAAARRAWAEHRPGREPQEVVLDQIVDRPGTDEDKAVFRFAVDGRHHRLTLGRRDGEWVFEKLQ